MKILHSADWHLGEFSGPVVNGQNARLLDTLACVDHLIKVAQEETPDVILIAGDLFDKSKLWADTMLALIDIAAQRLRQLAEVAPTVLLFGTENHDNKEAFQNIRDKNIPNLYVATTPTFYVIITKSGPLHVACIPGFDKGYFRAKNPGMDPTEENAMCSKLLGDIVLGLGTQIDPSIPSVLMAHYTVAGAEYDNGQMSIFNNSEVTLPREALAASPFDLVCLGHIHKAQEVPNCGRPTYYSGPLNGITFNEEGQAKGFWMHDVEMVGGVPRGESDGEFSFHYETSSRFIETPYRRFLTEKWDEHNIENIISYLGENPSWLFGQKVKDAIVRVHYSCSDELNKQLNRKALEKALYDAGAFYVSEIKPVQVTTTLTKQEMSENAGPLENLRSWCRAEGFTPEETLALEILARPLIDIVSAKMPTGKLSGVFVPKRIEVRNYRSYREESFDFNPIVSATVQGSVGVGKSALFMDALCDCLYEEPREGDLTGWISNDPSVKSGAITFDFGMGDTDWRVARTRTKSGKTTLALQEKVDGEWEDRAKGLNVRDVQEKITALLGMDAMTFRCCGLIMQDAYGLFLQAEKGDRMEVLGSILGLGIYEQLTELAKAKVTEVNRSITVAKEKLVTLNEKLKAVPETQLLLEETNKDIKQTQEDIASKETSLAETEELIRALQAKDERASELQRQILQNARDVEGLTNEKAEKQGKIDTAQKKLDAEEQILLKAAEYEQVKQQVAVLQTRAPRLKELGAEENRLLQDIDRTDAAARRLVPQIREVEDLLKDREELEKAAIDYQVSIQEDEHLNLLAEKDNVLREKVMEIERVTDRSADAIVNDKRRLRNLIEKTAMLLNSGCLDPVNASCAFLADAQESKKQIPELEKSIEQQEKERNVLLEQVAALEKESETIGYDSQKHYEVREKIKTLRPKAEKAAQLETKAQLLETLQGQKRQHEEQKTSLNQQLEKIQKESKALSTELEPLAGLEQRLPRLKMWVDAKDELPGCKEIVKSAEERIAAIDRDIARKEEQAKTLDVERKELVNSASQLEQHQPKAISLREEIRQQQGYKNTLHVKVGSLETKMEAFKKDLEEKNRIAADVEPAAKLLVQYQAIAKAFSLDGIPFSIVRAVVPELSAMANNVLADMTGGKMSLEIKLDKVQKSNKKEVNALEVWVNDYQRGSLPYLSRSGGQKVKSALSVAFALADLKARRAGIQLGMLFVDEPSFLDSEGTDAYVDALMSMSQRYGEMTVIAISHDPRLKARFPQIIEVVDMGDEGSKVRLIA
ncbi:MAG: exonuclease subunit SbcD [Desulfuromonadaceae bacterium]